MSAGVSDNAASGSSSGERGGGDIDDEAAVVQAYTRRRIQSVKVSVLCSHPPLFHVTNLQARPLTPASCSQVMLSADKGEAVHVALKTCGSILGNVVKHPTDDKYAWTSGCCQCYVCHASHTTVHTADTAHFDCETKPSPRVLPQSMVAKRFSWLQVMAKHVDVVYCFQLAAIALTPTQALSACLPKATPCCALCLLKPQPWQANCSVLLLS